MLWAVWTGLAIALLAVALGALRVAREALGAFRSYGRLRRETGAALDALVSSTERLAEQPDAAAKLEPALARLARSRAQLSVLLAAVDEVRDSVGRVTAFVPRK